MPIPTNPWVGDDRDRVVGIGEIVVGPEGAPRVPDGPPPDRRRMLELRRTPFDGATGYAAAYRRGDELTFVYALLSDRLEPRVAIGVGDERFEEDVDTGLFRTRGLWVRVLGSRGACFATLTRHVEHALSGVDGPLR